MNTPAWGLMNWRPINATPEALESVACRMRLWGATTVHDPEDSRRQGKVLWGADTEAGPIGLAWEWIEFQEDTIAMADPMTVLSNVAFVDEGGEPIAAWQRILYLNNVVHEIRWQDSLYNPPPESGSRRYSRQQQLAFLTSISV